MAIKSRDQIKTDSIQRYERQVSDPLANWIVKEDHEASDADLADSMEHILEGAIADGETTPTIVFDRYKGRVYGSAGAITSAIQFSFTNAIAGAKAYIQHNSDTAPTLPAQVVNPGDVAQNYRINTNNWIEFTLLLANGASSLVLARTVLFPMQFRALPANAYTQANYIEQSSTIVPVSSVSGLVGFAYRRLIATNPTITDADGSTFGKILIFDTTAAARNLSIRQRSTYLVGAHFTIYHKAGANAINVTLFAGDTISGITETLSGDTFAINQIGKYYTIVNTGSTWEVVEKYIPSATEATVSASRISMRKVGAGDGPLQLGTGQEAWDIIKPAIIDANLAASNTISFDREEKIMSTYTGAGKVALNLAGAIRGSVVTWYYQTAADPFNPIPEGAYLSGDTFQANTLMRAVLRFISTTQIEVDIKALGATDGLLRTLTAYWNMRPGYNGSNQIVNSGAGGAGLLLGLRTGLALPTYDAVNRELDHSGAQLLDMEGGAVVAAGTGRTIVWAINLTTLLAETAILSGGGFLARIFASGQVNIAATGGLNQSSATGAIVANTYTIIVLRAGTTELKVWKSTGTGKSEIITASGNWTQDAINGWEIGSAGGPLVGSMRCLAVHAAALTDVQIDTLFKEVGQLAQIAV